MFLCTRRRVALSALVCWLPSVASAGPGAADDALAVLNDAFRTAYTAAKAGVGVDQGPLIEVYEGDKLVLVRRGERREAAFATAGDRRLKTVAHAPLGVFVMLASAGDGPLTAERLDGLAQHRAVLRAAREKLTAADFEAAALPRQQKIMDASIECLDVAIAARRAARADVVAFARRVAPWLLENVAEVAQGQLERLHAQVSQWRREMTAEEWSELRVVVMGVHMARDGELATQYFVRLLGEPGEGRRVVYAEGLWDESAALDLVATHVLDGRIGSAFFGEDLRMHRDVFADAARAQLDVLGVAP